MSVTTSVLDRELENIESQLRDTSAYSSKEVLKASIDLLYANIKSVKVDKSIIDNNIDKALKDEILGRKVCEATEIMIKYEGSELSNIINYNFDLEKFTEAIQLEANNLKLEVEALNERSLIEKVEKPDENYIKYKLEIEKNKELVLFSSNLDTSNKKARQGEIKDKEAELTKKYNLIYQEQYVRMYDEYKESDKTYKNILINQKSKKENLDNFSLIIMKLNSYKAIINEIIYKIKDVADKTPSLKATLESNLTHPMTRQYISNPYISNNISGIINNLYMKYFKASFVNFKKDLLKLIGFNMNKWTTDNNPEKGILEMDAFIDLWSRMRYFEDGYMNPDILFTCILLNGINPDSVNKLKSTSVEKAIAFLSKKDKDPTEDTDTTDKYHLPLYNYIVEHIKTVHQTNKFTNSLSGGHHHKDSNQRSIKNQPDTETAAATSETLIKGELTRNNTKINVTDLETGKQFPYTATKQKCELCHPTQSKASHKPRCFGGKCNKCGYYGHKQNNCLQDNANKKASAQAMSVSSTKSYNNMLESDVPVGKEDK